MAGLDLIDHSPHHPSPAEKLASAANLYLIDNYDSFTWNVYQYLVLEGANVTVVRNDEVTVEDLIAAKPTQLVVSPGPGHPDTDSGISSQAIKHFSGKIPVLGVCMGQQCIISAFGGRVDITGEILHGKTSPLRHDTFGVYAGIRQDLPVTRYHSLAGTYSTLPDCLEVSSWVAKGPDGGKGVIMGVRHKEYVLEGVQFHPESILTEKGRMMLKNFLRMQGGTWAENKAFISPHNTVNGINSDANPTGPPPAATKMSILEKIYAHRKAAVATQKEIPSQRPADLQSLYDMGLAPPQISFSSRLKQSPYSLSLMGEIKRASPSKGIISLFTCAPVQARKYATAGASVISVLTEPEWFKGSVEDLRAVRQSLEGMANRPAVLRKEFIFEEYQILEARLAGADTILLIVKMLDTPTLTRLYQYSRSLGMEPLVEVNTNSEMRIAVELGAEVIGVNNRDLTNFEVDLGTTSRLMDQVSKETVVCALSGISGPRDVEAYRKDGVKAILVGEALMKAVDAPVFISNLLGGSSTRTKHSREGPIAVKICGTRSAEAAQVAIEAGADMIGMILVEGRKRFVPHETAQQISNVVHSTGRSTDYDTCSPEAASDFFEHSSKNLLHPRRAVLVGVFQNQPLAHVLKQQKLLNLDIVQLHGSEPVEWASLIPVPVIRSFKPGDAGLSTRGYHKLPLLDSGAGGSGQELDLSIVQRTLGADAGLQVILAGGLNPNNVGSVLGRLGHLRGQVSVVDVSSGVETGGQQDLGKIEAFIRAAKRA